MKQWNQFPRFPLRLGALARFSFDPFIAKAALAKALKAQCWVRSSSEPAMTDSRGSNSWRVAPARYV